MIPTPPGSLTYRARATKLPRFNVFNDSLNDLSMTVKQHVCRSSAAFLVTALTLATGGFAQDCPNEGRSHVAGPDDDISTVECAQLGFTFYTKIEANGSISVVTAGAAGAVEIRYQSPARCRTSQVTYDGDIHECGISGAGEKCKTKGYKVNQKKFTNLDPCPPANFFAIIRQFITQGGELPDCGELVEVDLGTNSVRWSATTSKCDDCSSVPTSEILPEGTLIQGPDSVYFATYGDPKAVPVESGESPFLPLTTGVDALLEYIEGPEGGDIAHPIEALRDACPPVVEFQKLSVRAQTVHHGVPGYGVVKNRHDFTGRFRSDGTYHLLLADVGTDEEGQKVPFVEEWTRDDDGIAFNVVGNPQALFFPHANGTARAKEVHRLPLVGRVTRWLENPFRLSTSPAARYETIQHEGYREVRLSFDADPAIAGVTRSYLFRDGAPWTRPVRAEVRTIAGELTETVDYGAYQMVAPGVFRPMTIKESIYVGGELAKTVEMTFAGEGADLVGTDDPMPLPSPLEKRWFVQVD